MRSHLLETNQAAAHQPPRPVGLLQRKCGCGSHAAGGQCGQCHSKQGLFQRDSSTRGTEETAEVAGVIHSPGQALDSETRALMESRFGQRVSSLGSVSSTTQKSSGELTVGAAADTYEREADAASARVASNSPPAAGASPLRSRYDFSHVRVHADGRSFDSARRLNAAAYTVGNDIVFGAGQYAPQTQAGRRLLAHELAHVVQQGQASPRGLIQRSITVQNPGSITPNPPLAPLNRLPMIGGMFDMTNAQIVESWIDQLCPDGNWTVNAGTGVVSSPDRGTFCAARPARGHAHARTSSARTSCQCICDLTAPGSTDIRLHAADFVALPSGAFDINAAGEGRTRPADPGAGRPEVNVGVSGKEFVGIAGAGDTSPHSGAGRAQVLRDPPWIILGHEMCGHARRGRQDHEGHFTSPEGDRSAVDIENRIRREHSTLADNLGVRKGTFVDAAGARHEGSVFRVSAGDTLSGIARRAGISRAGMLTHMFRENGAAITAATQNILAANERILIENVFWHEVITGETLTSIATMWDIPLASLKRANPNITGPRFIIRPGQRLLIPAS